MDVQQRAEASEQAATIKRELEDRAKLEFLPLTEIFGVNLLTAGTLAGILGSDNDSLQTPISPRTPVSPLEASRGARETAIKPRRQQAIKLAAPSLRAHAGTRFTRGEGVSRTVCE